MFHWLWAAESQGSVYKPQVSKKRMESRNGGTRTDFVCLPAQRLTAGPNRLLHLGFHVDLKRLSEEALWSCFGLNRFELICGWLGSKHQTVQLTHSPTLCGWQDVKVPELTWTVMTANRFRGQRPCLLRPRAFGFRGCLALLGLAGCSFWVQQTQAMRTASLRSPLGSATVQPAYRYLSFSGLLCRFVAVGFSDFSFTSVASVQWHHSLVRERETLLPNVHGGEQAY